MPSAGTAPSPTPPIEATCGNCKFFAESNVISVRSYCRRYPATTPTTSGDFCGEHMTEFAWKMRKIRNERV